MKNIYKYKYDFWDLYISEEDGAITFIDFDKIERYEYVENESELLKETNKQLLEYFKKERTVFDLPVKLNGTDFMNKVWKELMNIPYGKTVSYKYIAEKVGNAKASRAVGLANNKNCIPIIIPCHRVIRIKWKISWICWRIRYKENFVRC